MNSNASTISSRSVRSPSVFSSFSLQGVREQPDKTIHSGAGRTRNSSSFLYPQSATKYEPSATLSSQELNQLKRKRDHMRERASEWLDTGNYEGAVKQALEALKITERITKYSKAATLPDCLMLVRAYFKAGDRSESRYYLHQSTKFASQSPLEDPASNAALYSILAELYLLHGEVDAAENMYKTYRYRIEDVFGLDHIATSDCYNILAAFYTQETDYDTAIRYCGKALLIRIEQLGVDHRFTADSHYNMGLLYRLIGRPEEALTEFEMAKDIRIRVFQPFSLEVAEVELSIGFTSHQIGDLDKGFDAYRIAYEIKFALLGSNHIETIEAYNLLNSLCLAKGAGRFAPLSDSVGMIRHSEPVKQSHSHFTYSHTSPLNVELYDLVMLQRCMDELGDDIPTQLRIMIEDAARKEPLTVSGLNAAFGTLYPSHVQLILSHINNLGSNSTSQNDNVNQIFVNNQNMNRYTMESARIDNDANGGYTAWHSRSVFGHNAALPVSPLRTTNRKRHYEHKTSVPMVRNSIEDMEKPDWDQIGKDWGNVSETQGWGGIGEKAESYNFNVLERPSWMLDFDRKEKEMFNRNISPTHKQEESLEEDQGYAYGHGPVPDWIASMSDKERVIFGFESVKAIAEKPETISNKVQNEGLSNHHLPAQSQNQNQTVSTKVASSNNVGENRSDHKGFHISSTNDKMNSNTAANTTGRDMDKGYQNKSKVIESPIINKRTKSVEMSGEQLFDIAKECLSGLGVVPLLLKQKRAKERQKRSSIISKGQKESKENPLSRIKKQSNSKQAQRKTGGTGTKSDTRRLHWDVLENTEGTIWADLEDESHLDDSFTDLKDEFSTKRIEKKSEDTKSDKPTEMSFISDPKRRQNMAIFAKTLNKKNRTVNDVMDAVKNLQVEELNESILISMQEFFPTTDETDEIHEYKESKGDMSLLGPAEFYIHLLIQIPRYRQRVNALLFQMRFDDQATEIMKLNDILLGTSHSIHKSRNLARLLGIVLKVGNELNAGTSKGGAQGVKVSSLTKLNTTKSNTKKTLLEYIVEKIEYKDPKLLGIKQDLPLLAEAAKVNLKSLSADISKLRSGIKSMTATVKAANDAGNDHVFVEKLTPFLERATETIESMDSSNREANVAFSELCVYLGEDPSDTSPDTMFKELSTFVCLVDSTVTKVREKEARKRQKEERELKRKLKKKSSRSSMSSTEGGFSSA